MRYFYLLLLYTYGKNCAEMQRYSFFPLNTIFVSKESKLCTGGMSMFPSVSNIFCMILFCLIYKIGIFAVTKNESMFNLSVITFIVDVVVVKPSR